MFSRQASLSSYLVSLISLLLASAALAGFVDAGFFGWDDHYNPGVGYDAPSTCLRVSLAGTPLVAEQGFLTVFAIGPALPAGVTSLEPPAEENP